jgi:hypothetical protein
MARNLNIGMMVYDSVNYKDGVIKEINGNRVQLIDDWFNKWEVNIDKVFVVDVELSNTYHMLVCVSHIKSTQPYFVPIINNFVSDGELKTLSIQYA